MEKELRELENRRNLLILEQEKIDKAIKILELKLEIKRLETKDEDECDYIGTKYEYDITPKKLTHSNNEKYSLSDLFNERRFVLSQLNEKNINELVKQIYNEEFSQKIN